MLENQSITFAVKGLPVPQGSLRHVGGGRLVHRPDLVAWRLTVAAHAATAARDAGWVLPLDEPVSVSAMFFLPSPKRPRWPVPAVKPDLDKLQRAIGDALSPKHGLKVLAEDSRITHWDVTKNYGEPQALITIERERM